MEVHAKAKPPMTCVLSQRMRELAHTHIRAAQLRAMAGQVERALTAAEGNRSNARFVEYYTSADDFYRACRDDVK